MPFSSARQPRVRLTLDGAVAEGVIEAWVASNNHYSADRFGVALALAATPPVWAAGVQIAAEIAVSLDGGFGWTVLAEGIVDSVVLDPIQGVVRLDGRDRSAALIEARTEEAFANRTASEIAAVLAGRHGLACDAERTTTLVGRYWERDHDRLVLDQFARAVTEWDLLATLAQHEGFDLWVSGRTLHFRPAAQAPAVVLPVAAFSALRLERQMTFAGPVAVVVKSWNARQQQAFTATAQSGGPGGGGGVARRYVYVTPNLTPETAELLARRRLAEITGHELVLEGEMPGELALAPRMGLALADAPPGFARAWRIDEVERRVSVRDGFSQMIRARNAAGE